MYRPEYTVFLESFYRCKKDWGNRFVEIMGNPQVKDSYLRVIDKYMNRSHRNKFYKGNRTYFYLCMVPVAISIFLALRMFTDMNRFYCIILSCLILGYLEYFYYCDFRVTIGKIYIKYYKPKIKVKFTVKSKYKRIVICRDENGKITVLDLDDHKCLANLYKYTYIRYYICDRKGLGVALISYIKKEEDDLYMLIDKVTAQLQKDYTKILCERKYRDVKL